MDGPPVGGDAVTPDGWDVVLFQGAKDNRPTFDWWTPAQLAEWLCDPKEWHGKKVNVPAWSPVVMVDQDAKRAASNVKSITMLVLDCDSGESLDTLEAFGREFVRVAHTSWSHTPEHPKARIIFPFTRPCPVRHWGRVWGAAARWAADCGVTVDAAAKDPSRIYFGPYVPAVPGEFNPHLETYCAWGYGPDEGRGFLNWARLASAYPEPEPEPVVTPFGRSPLAPTADQLEKRRRAFASGVIAHRCRQIIAHGEGGRNVRVFVAARRAAQLAAGGWLNLADAAAQIEAAGVASGLTAKETRKAVRNGLARGDTDGPFDIDQYLKDVR